MSGAVKERPILFSGPMVRAILEGRKTQTRRVVPCRRMGVEFGGAGGRGGEDWKDPHYWGFHDEYGDWWGLAADPNRGDSEIPCPHGRPNDRLWVRETWRTVEDPGALPTEIRRWTTDDHGTRWPAVVDFRADNPHRIIDCLGQAKWRPSIHMPRWASRITLEITDVQVERLQDISEEDSQAEGAKSFPNGYVFEGTGYDNAKLCHTHAWFAFRQFWDSLNGKRPGCSWADNPWVWVISFRRVTP